MTDLAFVVHPQSLVQPQREDNQRTPTTAAGPCAPEVAAMVAAEIAVTPADRLPF